MRAGHISEESWSALLARRLSPHDLPARNPLFWTNEACVGVLRHRIRATACLHRAQHLARLAGHRLLVCRAVDACRIPNGPILDDPDLLRYLCSVPSLSATENLSGVLYLWEGAHLILEDKLSEHHGLVRGCRGVLCRLLLHEQEAPFDPAPSLPPHILTYQPLGMVLTIPNSVFQQSPLLQPGQCFLEPVHREWRRSPTADALARLPVDVQSTLHAAHLSVLRSQFPRSNPLACAAYSLQGQTLDAMIGGFARPPSMSRVLASVAFGVAFVSFFSETFDVCGRVGGRGLAQCVCASESLAWF